MGYPLLRLAQNQIPLELLGFSRFMQELNVDRQTMDFRIIFPTKELLKPLNISPSKCFSMVFCGFPVAKTEEKGPASYRSSRRRRDPPRRRSSWGFKRSGEADWGNH